MRKRKLLMAAITLLMSVSSAFAQKDVTSQYITNATLSNGTTGWTNVNFNAPQRGNNTVGYASECYAGWGSLEKENYSLTQTITLPAGHYTLVNYSFFRYGLNADTDASKSLAYLKAGNNQVAVKTLGSIEGAAGYANSQAEGANTFDSKMYRNSLDFTIDADNTAIEIGLYGTFDLKQSWMICGMFELINNDIPATMDAPFNVTGYITNPGFEYRNMTGWTISPDGFFGTQNNNQGFKVGGYYAEKWQKSGALPSGSMSQTLTNLPAGFYKLTANLGGNGTYIDLNGKTASWEADKDYTVGYVLGENENLVITAGKTAEGTANWIHFDNFRLQFCGDVAAALTTLCEEVTTYESKLPSSDFSTLQTAVGQYNKTYTDVDELLAAIDAIQALYESADLYVEHAAALAAAQSIDQAAPMNAEVLGALQTAMASQVTMQSTAAETVAATNALNTATANATTSIGNYAEAKTILEAANGYDEAGQTSYAANETIASIQSAYNDRSLTSVAAEQKTAAQTALATACKAQTQPADGCDMTAYIVNPGIDGNANGWTTEKKGNTNGTGGPMKPSNDAMEYWGASTIKDGDAEKGFDYYQTIMDLPTGAYTISADLLNSTNGEEGANWNGGGNAGVYGKTVSSEVQKLVLTDGDIFTTYTTDVILVVDGELRIGVKNINSLTGRWFACDNFKLTYARQLTAKEKEAVAKANALEVYNEALAAAKAITEGSIPTAAYTALQTVIENNTLTDGTSTEYNTAADNLNNAATTAGALVDNYAAYQIAVDDATIANVANETIGAQNTDVAAATTEEAIDACTTALRTAIEGVTSYDITSYFINNPAPIANKAMADGWEGDNFGSASDGVVEYWNQSAANFHQTINLKAGAYRLKVVALQRTNATGTVYAGSKQTLIAQVSNSIVNSRSQAANWFNEGNGVNTVYFTLAEDADVVIGLTADATTADHWTVWKSFALETYTESVAAASYKPGYDDAMAAAVAYQTVDMFDFDKTALNNAITANTVEEASATIAAYETAIENLNAATAAAAKAVADYTTYNHVVATIGENTNVDLTEFVTNAGFEEGNLNGWTNGGSISLQAQSNKAYGGHVGDYYAERWHVSGTLDLNQTISYLPAGVYKVTANAYSEVGDGILYANEDETGFAADGSYSVYIKLSDKSSLKIGAKGTLTSSTWFCVDNFTLTYVADDYVYALVDGKMNATVAAAQTAAETAFTETENGENYQALMTAIAAAQASKDAYATAGAAIANANALKEAHNFATADAITTFADAIAAIETPYNENTLADADAANAGNTLGTLVTGWHAGVNTAAVLYMNNGFSLTPDVWEGVYVNTWSTEGENDGSNFKVPFYEYFGDANTMTATLTGLENGLYSVSALVRVETTAEDVADATGITIDVNGGTAVDATAGEQIGESKFKLGTFTAEGLVKDGTLTFNISKLDGSNINWLSFKNIKYTKVRDLLPEESIVVATAEDLAALNNAITAAEAKTLGFDEGEYAPYNNVEALAALKAAKAIDQTMEYLPQEDVQAATTALTGATWTANEEEVNAVFNGDFAATANNEAPIGWTSTKGGAFSGQYMPRVFNNDDRLSEFNETKSAFFIRFDGTNSDRGTLYYYGNTENYTMPLKASTTYYVKADVKGWGSTGKPQRMNIGGPEGFSGKYNEVTLSNRADNDDAAPQQLLIIFTTTAAGDYTISFQCPGSDSNKHNAVVSNIELKRASAATLAVSDALYATFVAPFNVAVPQGVTAWTVGNPDDKGLLELTEVSTTIPANTPVVLQSTEKVDATTVYGYANPDTEPKYGLLTGVYAETPAPVGSYVLQKKHFDSEGKDVVGFYKVAEGKQPTVKANRAYLTVPAAAGSRPAFFLGDGETTGINAIQALTSGDAEIYNAAGARIPTLQKGMNIVKRNGKSYKVIVK